MTEQVVYITKERIEELKIEKQEIQVVTIPEVADRINRAKELGDLSENFEYHEARERMAFVQGRLQEIDDLLNRAILYKSEKSDGTVRMGSVVTVTKGGEEKVMSIVGAQEADPLQGKVSNESPLGSALLGKKVGEKALVTTPKGENVFVVTNIA